MFKRITDPKEIHETMDSFMNEPQSQRASFIAVIFSREHRPGGIAYEGHRPIAACQNDSERSYTLSTADSRYSQGVANLDLNKIEYLDLLQ